MYWIKSAIRIYKKLALGNLKEFHRKIFRFYLFEFMFWKNGFDEKAKNKLT